LGNIQLLLGNKIHNVGDKGLKDIENIKLSLDRLIISNSFSKKDLSNLKEKLLDY